MQHPETMVATCPRWVARPTISSTSWQARSTSPSGGSTDARKAIAATLAFLAETEGEIVVSPGTEQRAFQPGRDDDLAFRFGQDASVAAMAFLASVLWPLGEVDRACQLVEEMVGRATQRGQVATIVWGRCMSAQFELMLGRPARGGLM